MRAASTTMILNKDLRDYLQPVNENRSIGRVITRPTTQTNSSVRLSMPSTLRNSSVPQSRDDKENDKEVLAVEPEA